MRHTFSPNNTAIRVVGVFCNTILLFGIAPALLIYHICMFIFFFLFSIAFTHYFRIYITALILVYKFKIYFSSTIFQITRWHSLRNVYRSASLVVVDRVVLLIAILYEFLLNLYVCVDTIGTADTSSWFFYAKASQRNQVVCNFLGVLNFDEYFL